jgi:crotonobetainyl-CoA:carnitine CoA-transferase CaiB-like acyl-CoA transferase
VTVHDEEEMTGGERPPLVGIRIVDLTTAWAGPMAMRIISYLGAEVIHVEGPGRVDGWRGPLEGGDPRRYPGKEYGERPWNRNCMFNTQNAGKLGVAIDLKQAAGNRLMRQLIRRSDALVTNYSAGTLQRLGLSYEDLVPDQPGIIVMEMPAFGLTGEMAHHIALGPSMEAACGMAALTGYGDGRPVVTGPAYLDPIGAYNGAAALVSALRRQVATGMGQHIELAQCEAAMHWIGEEIIGAAEGVIRRPEGNAVPWAEPHDAFSCRGSDQWVAISVGTDRDWAALTRVIGRPELSGRDSALRTVLGRRRDRGQVRTAIESWTRTCDKQDAARALQAADIAAAPVCDGADVGMRDDLHEVGFYTELASPDVPAVRYQGLGLNLTRTPGRARRHAPTFGQDNDYVLTEILGLDPAEIDDLTASNVVVSRPLAAPPAQPAAASSNESQQ